jgi:diguanylate cyclase (GGDEF)-like protein
VQDRGPVDLESAADKALGRLECDRVISLKHYLDRTSEESRDRRVEDSPCKAILEAYVAVLFQMCESGGCACPAREQELKRSMIRVAETLRQAPTLDAVIASEMAVRDVLQGWGRGVAAYYDEKAAEVKDLLLVMSRTAESLGNKDDRIARAIGTVTEQLGSIATLDDVSRIRASVEASACELRTSLERMSAEGKALLDHLRAEVSTYQTKLENAERVSSRDALTGIGSRHWVESRILERIDSGTRFSIVLIDIDSFHEVVESYGNLVGDLLLKEFAKELRSACRFTDVVGRWGNDEFMLLLDEVCQEIRPKIDRLRATICRRYHVPGRTGYVNVPIAASIGVAEYRDGDNVQSVLERADGDLCRERSRIQEKSA